MKHRSILYYVMIFVGAVVAVYAQAGAKQNTVILIVGIVVLMYGVFKISQSIPSKSNHQGDDENHEKTDI